MTIKNAILLGSCKVKITQLGSSYFEKTTYCIKTDRLMLLLKIRCKIAIPENYTVYINNIEHSKEELLQYRIMEDTQVLICPPAK